MSACIRKIFDGIEIGEKRESLKIETGDNPSVVRSYVISGTYSIAAATAAGRDLLVRAFGSPPVCDGLPLASTRIQPYSGVPAWEFEATFALRKIDDKDKVAESNYSFNATSGAAKIVYSLETIAAVTIDGRDAIDFYGGINANENGGFDGVERVVPNPGFSISQSHPMGWFTRSTRILIMSMVGCINSDYFDGYAPGEAMFKGVEAKTARYLDAFGIQQAYWQATYSFGVMPNRIIKFGGEDVLKRGWDYAWRVTETRENPVTGKKESYPIQLNIERVYYPIPFSSLCLDLPE